MFQFSTGLVVSLSKEVFGLAVTLAKAFSVEIKIFGLTTNK